MADVTIHRATEDEAAALVATAPAEVREALTRPPAVRRLFLTARRDGRLVGGLWAATPSPDHAGDAWFLYLWVEPSFGEDGVHGRLVDAAAARLSPAGATELGFDIYAADVGVIALSESLGAGSPIGDP